MNKLLGRLAAFGLVLGVTACATVPDVEVTYYLPVTDVSVTVTQTIACGQKKEVPGIVYEATPEVTHRAGSSGQPIKLKQLNGLFRDTSATFEFYADGRLKGLNTKVVGKGKEAIESSVKLIGGIAKMGAPLVEPEAPDLCGAIRALDPQKEKPSVITLRFVGSKLVKDNDSLSAFDLIPDASSERLIGKLDDSAEFDEFLGRVAKVQITKVGGAGARVTNASSGELVLNLRAPGKGTLSVYATNTGEDMIEPGKLIDIAQWGQTYKVPIPTGALFGTEEFEIALAESGALQKLKYSGASGAAGTVDSLASISSLFGPTSLEDQVKETKLKADRIKESRRLAACLADSEACE